MLFFIFWINQNAPDFFRPFQISTPKVEQAHSRISNIVKGWQQAQRGHRDQQRHDHEDDECGYDDHGYHRGDHHGKTQIILLTILITFLLCFQRNRHINYKHNNYINNNKHNNHYINNNYEHNNNYINNHKDKLEEFLVNLLQFKIISPSMNRRAVLFSIKRHALDFACNCLPVHKVAPAVCHNLRRNMANPKYERLWSVIIRCFIRLRIKSATGKR